MTAINQDFTMHAGDTKILILTVKDEDGDIINLTGLQSAQTVIKKYPNSTTALVTKTLAAADIANPAPTTGVLSVTIAAADTSSFSAGEYYHETRMKDTNSYIGTIVTGTITVKDATTLS